MEQTEHGKLVRQYFINLEKIATEEQKQIAVDAAVREVTTKLNTDWSAYFICDPNDLHLTADAIDAHNEAVYTYGQSIYKYASTTEIKGRFGLDVDHHALAGYCMDYGLTVGERDGVPLYPAIAYARVHSIDIVKLFVDYYGSNQGEQTIDVDDVL